MGGQVHGGVAGRAPSALCEATPRPRAPQQPCMIGRRPGPPAGMVPPGEEARASVPVSIRRSGFTDRPGLLPGRGPWRPAAPQRQPSACLFTACLHVGWLLHARLASRSDVAAVHGCAWMDAWQVGLARLQRAPSTPRLAGVLCGSRLDWVGASTFCEVPEHRSIEPSGPSSRHSAQCTHARPVQACTKALWHGRIHTTIYYLPAFGSNMQDSSCLSRPGCRTLATARPWSPTRAGPCRVRLLRAAGKEGERGSGRAWQPSQPAQAGHPRGRYTARAQASPQ